MEKKIVKGYKGFNQDWTCNRYQYKPNSEHIHKGEVQTCSSGFHFCENPIDVFGYYGPGHSRYAEVEGSGDISNHDGDSKVACSHLKIGAEISLHAYIKLAVDFIFSKIDKSKKQTLIEDIATNTGDQSAATNTGDQSAATNTGYQSAATNTGDQSAATNTGHNSAATNTGH